MMAPGRPPVVGGSWMARMKPGDAATGAKTGINDMVGLFRGSASSLIILLISLTLNSGGLSTFKLLPRIELSIACSFYSRFKKTHLGRE